MAAADFVVTGLTANASVPYGQSYSFSYTIKNVGSQAAGSSHVSYRVGDSFTAPTFSGSDALSSLGVGSTTQTITHTINTAALAHGEFTVWVIADSSREVTEGDETNNIASFTFTVAAPMEPDLAVTSITAPVSVAQGNNLDFSYVIKNEGTATAGGSYAAFRIDQIPDVANWVAYNQVAPLIGGSSATLSASFSTANLSVGTHTLWVAADNWSQVAENREFNNLTSVTFTVTAPARADLVVSSITAGSVSQGANLDFSYVVQNSGLGAAGQTYAAFRVDQRPDIANWISYNSVDPLAAGATDTINASFNTAGLSVGTHTLWVAADNWSYVGEGNENNNWTSVTFNVTAPARADLVVSSITAGSVSQGANLDFSYVVQNSGLGAAGQTYAAFRVDQRPDIANWIAYNSVDPLAAGATDTINASFNTAGLSVGTHTLWVAADNWSYVGEGNENNNWTSVTFNVTAPVRADLVVSSITAGSVSQGANLDFSYVVQNSGLGAAGQTYAAFRVDQMPDIAHWISYNSVDPLAAGATDTINASFNTAGLSVGIHTLWVAADNWSYVGEGNENNNWTSVTFNVTAPVRADLVVSSITAGSVSQGANLDFSYVVQNSGLGAAGQTYAAFRVDQRPDIANWISYNSVDPLAAGATDTINASFNTAGLSVGTHTLWVAADNWSYVGEGNENNNWTSVTFNVTAPARADLVVSSITAGSVSQGANLDFSYVVQNSGLGAAGQTYAAFRVDQRPDIANWIAYNSVDPLAAGATDTINASFNTAGLSVGTHTLWVAADNWSYVGEGNENNNWTSVTFNVTAPVRADLVVSSITAGSVSQGANLDFSYVVQNSGLGAAGQTYAAFRVDQMPDIAHWISYNSVDPLAAGASDTINASFNTAGLSVGTHTLWVAADNWSYVGEGNESNNWTSVTFNVTAPPSADLVVSSVSASSVAQGTDLNFSYVVKNSGVLAAAQTYAAFRVDQMPDIAHWISYNSVDPLAAGASETINASFNTANLSVGTHTLWVATDNWGYVNEGNEANNWTSTTFNVTAPSGGSSFSGATFTMVGGTYPLSSPPVFAPHFLDDHFIV